MNEKKIYTFRELQAEGVPSTALLEEVFKYRMADLESNEKIIKKELAKFVAELKEKLLRRYDIEVGGDITFDDSLGLVIEFVGARFIFAENTNKCLLAAYEIEFVEKLKRLFDRKLIDFELFAHKASRYYMTMDKHLKVEFPNEEAYESFLEEFDEGIAKMEYKLENVMRDVLREYIEFQARMYSSMYEQLKFIEGHEFEELEFTRDLQIVN